MSTDVITIDGPTSSGKNSVGFLLAQKLKFQYIDTGYIYRAGSYFILRHGISINDDGKVEEAFRNLQIEIKKEDGGIRVILSGEDVTDFLHSPEVGETASQVAARPAIREILKALQRKIGALKNTVMSGRDIGSEIFPMAKHKFFLTASIAVRAKRRYEQLKKVDPETKYEDVLNAMLERDKRDSTRKASPMRIPPNAKVIDNSNLTVEQTVEKMLEFMKL